MSSPLPIQVLARLAPILSLAEGSGMVQDRASFLWRSGTAPRLGEVGDRERERTWLGQYFRSASEDILDAALDDSVPKRFKASSFGDPIGSLSRVSPVEPGGEYDLRASFRFLADRYLQWSGQQILIKTGRMAEVHELSRIFPVSQVVRYHQATKVVEGTLPTTALVEKFPFAFGLHSANRSLRVIVERGLAEGHMHLKGVSSAAKYWAALLLADSFQEQRASFTSEQRTDRRIYRLVFRLLVIAYILETEDRVRFRSNLHLNNSIVSTSRLCRTLADLDDVLTEQRSALWRGNLRRLEERIDSIGKMILWGFSRRKVREDERVLPILEGVEGQMLGYLLAPDAFHLRYPNHRYPSMLGLEAEATNWLDLQLRATGWMHLKVHERLCASGEDRRGRVQSEDGWSRDGTSRAPSFPSEFLTKVFLRYLACQARHIQLVVQPRHRRRGLAEFKSYYDSPHRRDSWDQARSVLSRLFKRERIELLEGRVTPSLRGRRTVRPWVREYAVLRQERALRRRLRFRGEVGLQARGGRARDWQELGFGERGGGTRERMDPDERFGVVIHFLRDKADPLDEISHLPKGSFYTRLRYEGHRRRVRREAIALLRLLREPDPIVPFILGIDAANLEYNGTPPEVFAPAFRFLRDEPIDKFKDDSFRRRFSYGHDLPVELGEKQLALTFHVGEDFANILSGLRAIDEAVEFLGMRPGDRLGHATALGLDPMKWAKIIGRQTVLPKQEFLDTLVWTRQVLGPGHDLIGELGIEDWIHALSAEIYGITEEIEPLTLYMSWLLRQIDPELLELRHAREDVMPLRKAFGVGSDQEQRPFELFFRADFQRRTGTEAGLVAEIPMTREEERWRRIQQSCLDRLQRTDSIASKGRDAAIRMSKFSRKSRKLHWKYLYDNGVKRRGARSITVDLLPGESWMEVIRDVQRKMCAKVHDRHLVVETNPSSNVTIGPFSSYAEHHLFHLTHKDTDLPMVVATVNTDDPGVFNTSLAHEYYLLGEAMLERGYAEAEVQDWLERLRKSGHDYSFLADLRRLDADQIDALCEEVLRMHDLRTWIERTWLPPGFMSLR